MADQIDAEISKILAQHRTLGKQGRAMLEARDYRGLAQNARAIRANNVRLLEVTRSRYPQAAI